MTDQEVKIAQLNNQIKTLEKEGAKVGKISDGYHTFDELYDHRIQLFICLANILHATKLNSVWKSRTHSDGTSWEGWFIAGISTVPGEQISYHLPESKWEELKVQELDKAPEWDGHTPTDVIERLKSL